MNKVTLISALLLLAFTQVKAQDLIERDYFPNARAKNASVAAARYAEEGYHYSKFITYINAVDSSRMFADTALFFVKRSMMLGDTALSYAPKGNVQAVDYLRQAKEKSHVADTIIREFYPMIEIESHHVFAGDAALHLSNSVMDYFNASLLLRSEYDAPASETDRYEVLPFDDEIIRLEADEAAFQMASNAYEDEIAELNIMSAEVDGDLSNATKISEISMLQRQKEKVAYQLKFSTDRLLDTSTRISEIRYLLDKKYLDDVADVVEPEHMPLFETTSNNKVIEMDEIVPDGLVYKIQLGYYPSNVDVENFHGLFPISGETVTPELGRYYAGVFYSYSEASQGNDYVQNNAIANAFVVPFYNGNKISIGQAVEIEQQRGVK